jgi:hypothetical protein
MRRLLLTVLLLGAYVGFPLTAVAALPRQEETNRLLCFQINQQTAADCDLAAEAISQSGGAWSFQRVVGAGITQIANLSDYDVLTLSRGSADALPKLDGGQVGRVITFIKEGGRLLLHDAALAGELDVELTAPVGNIQVQGGTELTRAGALFSGISDTIPFQLPSAADNQVPVSTLGGRWQVLMRAGSGNDQAAVMARATFENGTIVLAPGGLGSSDLAWDVVGKLCCLEVELHEMRIDAIEITQAVQDLNNSVTLVIDKETWARVHVSANEDTAGVTAVLRGYRSGEPLTPAVILPDYRSAMTVSADPDRGNLYDSFNFELPDSWVDNAGVLTLEAEIFPAASADDFFAGNNVMSESVALTIGPPLKLRTVNVEYTEDGTSYRAARSEVTRLHEWLKAALPVSDVSLRRRVYTYDGGLPDATVLNNLLALLWLADVLGGMDDETHMYGIVSDGGGFMRGRALGIPSKIASGPTGSGTFGWDLDGTYGDWYGLHELGHTFGRYHAEFCGAGGGAAFPYTDGRISDDLTGNDALYGFNTADVAVYGPEWTDMMTYCDNQWVSDYTYEGIRSHMLSEYGTSSPPPPAQPRNAAAEMLAVVGNLQLARRSGEIVSARVLTGQVTPTNVADGRHTLALVGSNGDLAVYGFTPAESYDHDDRRRPAQVAELVPWQSGTTAIEIRDGDKVLARREVSANPPQVGITAPQGGAQPQPATLTVSWQASDADGDELTADIYRSDGNGWLPLLVDVAGSSAEVDLSDTGGGAVQLKVVVSDGVWTAEDVTTELSVADQQPSISLRGPADDSVFYPLAGITLRALVEDAEGAASVSWASSRDGELGQGTQLRVDGLSTGMHLITATVSDSSNQTTQTVRRIVIAPGEQAPTPVLAASQASLALTAAATDDARGTLISLRLPSGNATQWSAAAGAAWIKVNAVGATAAATASGALPGRVRVTVDPRGKAVGEYSSQVVVSAGGMTLTIPVTLNVIEPPTQQLIPTASR